MKKQVLIIIFSSILISCSSTNSKFVKTNNKYRTGVDFTSGKWLLNRIDCPIENVKKLTEISTQFFQKNLDDRLFKVENVKGLLINPDIALNPNRQKIKELKIGTGFDYFINISSKKSKNDLSTIGFYEDENTKGKNQSEITVEIYDLNLAEIIYSQQVIGTDKGEKQKSMFETHKSDKLIDNINFHRSSLGLMKKCLKKVLKDLRQKSILKSKK